MAIHMFNKKVPEEKELQFIGEVLVKKDYRPFGNLYPAHEIVTDCHKIFSKFTYKNIGENHDGFIKIFGMFHKQENVFYYDEIYNSLRNKIMKGN